MGLMAETYLSSSRVEWQNTIHMLVTKRREWHRFLSFIVRVSCGVQILKCYIPTWRFVRFSFTIYPKQQLYHFFRVFTPAQHTPNTAQSRLQTLCARGSSWGHNKIILGWQYLSGCSRPIGGSQRRNYDKFPFSVSFSERWKEICTTIICTTISLRRCFINFQGLYKGPLF